MIRIRTDSLFTLLSDATDPEVDRVNDGHC